MSDSRREIREFLGERLAGLAQKRGLDIAQLGEEQNLFEFGVIDSLGFLTLVAAVEERFGLEVDFGEMDPAGFTHLRGLVELCAGSPRV